MDIKDLPNALPLDIEQSSPLDRLEEGASKAMDLAECM